MERGGRNVRSSGTSDMTRALYALAVAVAFALRLFVFPSEAAAPGWQAAKIENCAAPRDGRAPAPRCDACPQCLARNPFAPDDAAPLSALPFLAAAFLPIAGPRRAADTADTPHAPPGWASSWSSRGSPLAA
jgi:hypothetical protein